MELFGIYIFAYLVGSLPTAHVLAKLVKGVTCAGLAAATSAGSNLYQIAGAKWFGFLLVFDLLVKGATPVWIGRHFLGLEQSPELLVVVPLLAVVGNNWSVFLGVSGRPRPCCCTWNVAWPVPVGLGGILSGGVGGMGR